MKQKIFNVSLFQLVLWLALGLSSQFSMGQKEPQYTQYMYNIGSFNPAYVGTTESAEIIGLYRAQWIDIDGAPRTLRLGLNLPFKNEKNGLGFNVISDQIGPTTNTYIDVAYSFQINLSDYTKLSFGIDAGGSFLNVDFSKGTFENPGEPILYRAQIQEFYPTVGAGLFLYADNWYLGASSPNFLTDGLYDEDVATIVDDQLHLNFIGGYVFDISGGLKFKPAFLVNYVKGLPLNVNASANFLISEAVTLGASYRFDNAFSGLAGFQIGGTTFIGYSYEYNTNTLADFNNGSHEIILKFFPGRKSNRTTKDKSKKKKSKDKQIDSPRFF